MKAWLLLDMQCASQHGFNAYTNRISETLSTIKAKGTLRTEVDSK
jgi:hypothetical protein